MTEGLHDFDAAFAEAEARGERRIHPFKLFGETYKLPAQPPLAFVVSIKAIQEKHGSTHELSADDLVRMLSTLFTRSVVDSWTEQGMDVDQMMRVVMWAGEQWGIDTDGDGDGEDPPAGATGSGSS